MHIEAGYIPGWLILGWTLVVGGVLGSFLNVVIARVPAGESIVRPRSRCPACKAFIRWYDNVPIVSWLALRARCRSCGARISARYPLVEALSAAGAVIEVQRHGFSAAAAVEFAFVATLIALAFIDVDTWLLPNSITWPLIAFGLAVGFLGITPAGSLRSAAYGAGLGFAAFALLSWLGEKAFKKEALGFGDVWLLSGLGAFLGVAALLPIVLLASIQGAVVGIALLALARGEPGPSSPPLGGGGQDPALRENPSGRREEQPDSGQDHWVPPKHAVPFGPFLVAAALEWLWVGGLLADVLPVLRFFR